MSSRVVLDKKLHFVFRDAELAYDCGECKGKCCRHGDFFVAAERELVQIGRVSQDVWPFLSSFHSASQLSGSSYYPQCWFLDPKGRCGLQEAGGVAAKPLNCLLFPANDLVVFEDTCYVDVALSCPLGLVDVEGVSGTVLTHDAVMVILELAPSLESLGPQTLTSPFADWNAEMASALSRLHETTTRSGDFVRAEVAPVIDRLHRLFFSRGRSLSPRLEAALWALMPSFFFKLMIRQLDRIRCRASFASAAARSLDSLTALRFLLEVASSLSATEAHVGVIGDLFRRNLSFLETLGVLHLPVTVRENGPARGFSAPEHMLHIANAFAEQLERNSGEPLLHHLEALELQPSQVRGVIDMITHNCECFRFGQE